MCYRAAGCKNSRRSRFLRRRQVEFSVAGASPVQRSAGCATRRNKLEPSRRVVGINKKRLGVGMDLAVSVALNGHETYIHAKQILPILKELRFES